MIQFTLRTIRESCGYSVEEAASYCGVSVATFNSFQINSSLITIETIQKISELFVVPLDLLFDGLETDCAKKNRRIIGMKIAP